jgi:ferredoxin-fold anticodon binding domain-containing protein
MNAAISLTYILDKLVDLLPLTYDQLQAMSAKELRDDVAKILGISKAYQLKKPQLLDACWDALENVRNQLQVDQSERDKGKELLQRLKKNDDYIVPTTTVASAAYGRLREIAQKGANLQEMKEAINGVVAAIARSEMRKFEFSTVKTRRVDINRAMQAAVDAEIPLLKETMEILVAYFYSQLLSFQRDDSVELSKTYRQKVKGKNSDKTPIEITKIVEDCHRTLDQLRTDQEPHWTKVSVAAALGTGRRMAEIHSLGSFQVAGDYSLHFTGQAKTRGAEDAKTDYVIPTLFLAATLKRAIDYLEEQGRRLDPEVQKSDRNAVNKTYAMALSRAVGKYPGITYKGLRAIYAECQWALLPESEKVKTSQHRKYSDWLGHIDKDGSIDTTFVSYMVYNVTDIDAVKKKLKKAKI